VIFLLEALIKPLRISIDKGPDKPPRVYSIRPVVMMIAIVSLLLAAAMVGSSLTPQKKQTSLLAQLAHLQHEQKRLSATLSETEALLSLRDGQIEGLNQEMQLQRNEKLSMLQRLEVFDDVLAARKVQGVHFLRPQFNWKERNLISYKLILVKGDNYPRWIIGHLKFSVTDSNGHVLFLNNEKGKDSYKVEITSQEFIEGTLVWTQKWQPKNLTVTLINHEGRQTGSIEIPITGIGALPGNITPEQKP